MKNQTVAQGELSSSEYNASMVKKPIDPKITLLAHSNLINVTKVAS
jgi:hypothetical protein